MANEYNKWRRFDGNFDFCHPSETQAQIIFDMRDGNPFGRSMAFTLSLEEADELGSDATVLEAAHAVLAKDKRALFSSTLTAAETLVSYLAATERDDNIGAARHKVASIRERIGDLQAELEQAEADLSELETDC